MPHGMRKQRRDTLSTAYTCVEFRYLSRVEKISVWKKNVPIIRASFLMECLLAVPFYAINMYIYIYPAHHSPLKDIYSPININKILPYGGATLYYSSSFFYLKSTRYQLVQEFPNISALTKIIKKKNNWTASQPFWIIKIPFM